MKLIAASQLAAMGNALWGWFQKKEDIMAVVTA